MEHRQFEEMLLLYFYGELSEEERREFEEHYRSCPLCQKEYAQLSKLSFWLEELESIKPKEKTLKRIRSQARKSATKPLFERIFAFPAYLRWSLSFLGALIIFGIIAWQVWKLPGGTALSNYDLWNFAENVELLNEQAQALVYDVNEQISSSNLLSQKQDYISQLELEIEEVELLASGVFEI